MCRERRVGKRKLEWLPNGGGALFRMVSASRVFQMCVPNALRFMIKGLWVLVSHKGIGHRYPVIEINLGSSLQRWGSV